MTTAQTAALVCTSCGTTSEPLSDTQTCQACRDRHTRQEAAAAELRAWKRYPAAQGTAGDYR